MRLESTTNNLEDAKVVWVHLASLSDDVDSDRFGKLVQCHKDMLIAFQSKVTAGAKPSFAKKQTNADCADIADKAEKDKDDNDAIQASMLDAITSEHSKTKRGITIAPPFQVYVALKAYLHNCGAVHLFRVATDFVLNDIIRQFRHEEQWNFSPDALSAFDPTIATDAVAKRRGVMAKLNSSMGTDTASTTRNNVQKFVDADVAIVEFIIGVRKLAHSSVANIDADEPRKLDLCLFYFLFYLFLFKQK